jgi:hypothetical protein
VKPEPPTDLKSATAVPHSCLAEVIVSAGLSKLNASDRNNYVVWPCLVFSSTCFTERPQRAEPAGFCQVAAQSTCCSQSIKTAVYTKTVVPGRALVGGCAKWSLLQTLGVLQPCATLQRRDYCNHSTEANGGGNVHVRPILCITEIPPIANFSKRIVSMYHPGLNRAEPC